MLLDKDEVDELFDTLTTTQAALKQHGADDEPWADLLTGFQKAVWFMEEVFGEWWPSTLHPEVVSETAEHD